MAPIPVTGIGHIAVLGTVTLVVWYLVTTGLSYWRLRHIPGPILSRFSYLWLASVCAMGSIHVHFPAARKQYGSLVRVGPNEVLTDNPEMVRRMASAKSTYLRTHWYNGARLNPYHASMFNIVDPKPHDKLKAKVSMAYSGRDLEDIEMAVNSMIHQLKNLIRRLYVSDIESCNFEPMDMCKITTLFTIDVISRFTLGKEIGALENNKDPYDFLGVAHESEFAMGLTTAIPWLAAISSSSTFLKLFGPKTTDKRGWGMLLKFVNDVVAKHYTTDAKNEKTMIASMVRHGLTQTECETEGLFAFMAGADTTASAMRTIVLNVIANPRVYQRLRKEIADAVQVDKVSSPIQLSEAKKLPYLQAVIYEGLRYRPVAVGSFAKQVPPGGDYIDGKFVPEGTSVGINYLSMMHSTERFGADADVFRPERFLVSSGTETGVKADTEAMRRDVELGFGYGRWMCAGKAIGLMELNKFIFEMFRSFDLQLVDAQHPMESKGFITWSDQNFIVRATESDLRLDD